MSTQAISSLTIAKNAAVSGSLPQSPHTRRFKQRHELHTQSRMARLPRRCCRHDHVVVARNQEPLLKPDDLAQAPPYSVSCHSMAHTPAHRIAHTYTHANANAPVHKNNDRSLSKTPAMLLHTHEIGAPPKRWRLAQMSSSLAPRLHTIVRRYLLLTLTVKRLRPFARRRRITLRPPAEAMRFRKPCTRLRRRLWG
jgi:hypothetical protein